MDLLKQQLQTFGTTRVSGAYLLACTRVKRTDKVVYFFGENHTHPHPCEGSEGSDSVRVERLIETLFRHSPSTQLVIEESPFACTDSLAPSQMRSVLRHVLATLFPKVYTGPSDRNLARQGTPVPELRSYSAHPRVTMVDYREMFLGRLLLNSSQDLPYISDTSDLRVWCETVVGVLEDLLYFDPVQSLFCHPYLAELRKRIGTNSEARQLLERERLLTGFRVVTLAKPIYTSFSLWYTSDNESRVRDVASILTNLGIRVDVVSVDDVPPDPDTFVAKAQDALEGGDRGEARSCLYGAQDCAYDWRLLRGTLLHTVKAVLYLVSRMQLYLMDLCTALHVLTSPFPIVICYTGAAHTTDTIRLLSDYLTIEYAHKAFKEGDSEAEVSCLDLSDERPNWVFRPHSDRAVPAVSDSGSVCYVTLGFKEETPVLLVAPKHELEALVAPLPVDQAFNFVSVGVCAGVVRLDSPIRFEWEDGQVVQDTPTTLLQKKPLTARVISKREDNVIVITTTEVA